MTNTNITAPTDCHTCDHLIGLGEIRHTPIGGHGHVCEFCAHHGVRVVIGSACRLRDYSRADALTDERIATLRAEAARAGDERPEGLGPSRSRATPGGRVTAPKRGRGRPRTRPLLTPDQEHTLRAAVYAPSGKIDSYTEHRDKPIRNVTLAACAAAGWLELHACAYRITDAGRAALRQHLAEVEARNAEREPAAPCACMGGKR